MDMAILLTGISAGIYSVFILQSVRGFIWQIPHGATPQEKKDAWKQNSKAEGRMALGWSGLGSSPLGALQAGFV